MWIFLWQSVEEILLNLAHCRLPNHLFILSSLLLRVWLPKLNSLCVPIFYSISFFSSFHYVSVFPGILGFWWVLNFAKLVEKRLPLVRLLRLCLLWLLLMLRNWSFMEFHHRTTTVILLFILRLSIIILTHSRLNDFIIFSEHQATLLCESLSHGPL